MHYPVILQNNAEDICQHQRHEDAVDEVSVLRHHQGTGLEAVDHHRAQHDCREGVTGDTQRE